MLNSKTVSGLCGPIAYNNYVKHIYRYIVYTQYTVADECFCSHSYGLQNIISRYIFQNFYAFYFLHYENWTSKDDISLYPCGPVCLFGVRVPMEFVFDVCAAQRVCKIKRFRSTIDAKSGGWCKQYKRLELPTNFITPTLIYPPTSYPTEFDSYPWKIGCRRCTHLKCIPFRSNILSVARGV